MAEETSRRRRIHDPSGKEVGNYRDLSRGPLIPRVRTVTVTRQSKKLWPVYVLEEKEDKARIHYIGWPHKYDEWREKVDIHRHPQLPHCQSSVVISQLKIQIKEQLLGTSRRDSRRTIRIAAVEADFEELSSAATVYKQTRTKTVYHITNRQCLERVLGTAWDYRVVNEEGDNFFAKNSTIRFYLTHRKPLKEYLVFPDHVEMVEQERGTNLVFSFVVCSGNKSIFNCLLNDDML